MNFRRIAFCVTAALALVVFHGFLAALVPAGIVLAGEVGTTAGVSYNVNEAMKIIFEEPLTNSIVQDSELLDCFEQDMDVAVSETTGGRYIELAHYFSLPSGVGARALEGDYIPVPNGPVIKNSQIWLKKIEGVVQMSGDTMRRVKRGEGAFSNWAQRHLPDLKLHVDHEIDRMLLGFGAGIKARVNDADPDAGAKTYITIDAALGVAGLEDAWLMFMEGESIVFAAAADGTTPRTTTGARTIVDIDPDLLRLELDSVVGVDVADDDYIFAGDAAGASYQNSGVDREIMGLLGMVDNGDVLASFQGLTRADYRPWRSQVVDGSAAPWGGQLTEDLITKVDDDTYIRAKGVVDQLLTSRSGVRNYWRNLKDDKRLNDPRAYTGGKSSVGIILGDRTVELKVIRKMPSSLMFGLQKDTFKHWRNTGWEWDDLTGSIWNRVTDATGRKDSFYAVGHMVMQTGGIAPHKSFKITGLDTEA